VRKIFIGDIVMTRVIGIMAPAAAATSKTRAADINPEGSQILLPVQDMINRRSAKMNVKPKHNPDTTIAAALRKTAAAIRPRCAPSAILTPNSLSRRDIEYDTTLYSPTAVSKRANAAQAEKSEATNC